MIDQIEARLHLARMAFPQALTNVGIDSDAALKYIDVARRAADDGLVSYAVIVVSEAYSAALAGHTRRRRRTGIPGCYRVRFAAVASVSVSSGGCACITSGNLTSQRLSAACAHASWHASAFKRHIGVDRRSRKFGGDTCSPELTHGDRSCATNPLLVRSLTAKSAPWLRFRRSCCPPAEIDEVSPADC